MPLWTIPALPFQTHCCGNSQSDSIVAMLVSGPNVLFTVTILMLIGIYLVVLHVWIANLPPKTTFPLFLLTVAQVKN